MGAPGLQRVVLHWKAVETAGGGASGGWGAGDHLVVFTALLLLPFLCFRTEDVM